MKCRNAENWNIIRIGDAGKIVTGKTPPTKRQEFFNGNIPFITPTDINSNSYSVKTARYLSELARNTYSNYLLPKGSVCVVCIGATIGKICMSTEPSFTNQQINSVVTDRNNFDNRFIYYLLKIHKDDFKSIAGGAATPIINKTAFSNVKIKVPKLSLQQKIGAFLFAYDDLIENNNRRIQILEEMAQRIYREWFVYFRFPCHENVKMVDSELGMIPEGWKVVSFTDIADVLSGGTPKTKIPEYWNGDIPFFAPKDAPTAFYVLETEKSITDLGLSKCNSQLYPKDTVFITARGTVGKVVMPSLDMAMNQSCYALKGKNGIKQFYLFLATKNGAEYLKKNTGGATFDTIIVDTFKRMKIVKPPIFLIDKFVNSVNPIFDMILNLLSP